MDRIAERKHRHELKRKAKRKAVRLEKARTEGKIGKYGSGCYHHHGNMPKPVPPPSPAEPVTQAVTDGQ